MQISWLRLSQPYEELINIVLSVWESEFIISQLRSTHKLKAASSHRFGSDTNEVIYTSRLMSLIIVIYKNNLKFKYIAFNLVCCVVYPLVLIGLILRNLILDSFSPQY